MRYVALVLFGVLISTFILALRHSEGAAREDLTAARFVFIVVRLLPVESLLGWLVPMHHELLVVADNEVVSLDISLVAVAEILV